MFCPSCGSQVGEGSKFCGNCGSPIDPSQSAPTTEIPPKPEVAPTQEVPPVQDATKVMPQQPVPPAGAGGTPVPPAGVPVGETVPMGSPTPGPAKSSGKAIGALVCGILSIVFSGSIVLGIILGIIAIVLAVQVAKQTVDGKAKAGKICGIIGLVLSAIALLITIITGAALFSYMAGNPDLLTSSSSSSSISSSKAPSSKSSSAAPSSSSAADKEAAAIKKAQDAGKIVVSGVCKIYTADQLAAKAGIDLKMLTDSDGKDMRYAVVEFSKPTSLNIASSGDMGNLMKGDATMVCVASVEPEWNISTGNIAAWEPYVGKNVTVALVPKETWWPSDVSLPINEPRTSTAELLF